MNCPICCSSDTTFVCFRSNPEPELNEQYPFRKCSVCSHIYMDKEFSDEELSHLYTRFYPRNTFDPSKYQPHEERQGFLAWLDGVKTSAYRYVPKNVRILDIGCGSCETLGYHQKRGCEVYGVETDENVKPIVEQNHFQVHFGLFNPDVFEKSSFDFITMDHVLEHCQNPLETIKGIGTLLKDSNICDKIWGGGG